MASKLGTRELYDAIERNRRERQLRARLFMLAFGAIAFAGMWGASLGLAHILDGVHRLFQ